MASKSQKSALAFFAENAVARARATRGGDGGRYNFKTRRLVVPSSFAGRSVAVAVSGGVLVVGGDGKFRCHPTQHFVTLPVGTVAVAESVTLEKIALPSAVAELGENAVAYRLPKVAKKSAKKSPEKVAKKSAKKSPEKSPEKSA